MIIERGEEFLETLVKKQLKNFFSFEKEDEIPISDVWENVLKKTEYLFNFCKNKYYSRNDQVYFSPFHSSQYTVFLYFLSKALGRDGTATDLADRVYYLNKALNSVDLYHQVDLPDIFFLDHPLGSVIGRAEYGDYFSFRQNCTVGNNKGKYPRFGKNVKLMANSTVVGDSNIGDNVIISVGATVKDEDIKSNSLVFGNSPNLIVKSRGEDFFEAFKGYP